MATRGQARRVAWSRHVVGNNGEELLEGVRQLGAEGIVSKPAGTSYRGGPDRDWLKAKVSEEGAFVITGFVEREAVAVAELRDSGLLSVSCLSHTWFGKEVGAHFRDLSFGLLCGGIKFVAEVLARWILKKSHIGAGWNGSWTG